MEKLSIRRDSALNKFGKKLFLSKRYRNFLPDLNIANNYIKLRNPKPVFYQPINKHVRYENSTLVAIVKNVNSEFIETGKIFGYTLENARVIDKLTKSDEINNIVK